MGYEIGDVLVLGSDFNRSTLAVKRTVNFGQI